MTQKDLERIFTSASPPWLHLVACGEQEFANWSAWWTNIREGVIIQTVARTIRGKKCSTNQSLFDEFGAALQFPYYFGENWDALDECLADLAWLSARAYILFIPNAEHVLADSNEDFRILINVLQTAAAEWADFNPPVPFHIVFQCKPELKDVMISRLKTAGADFFAIKDLVDKRTVDKPNPSTGVS